jgi:CheY-like chemotaxis protein
LLKLVGHTPGEREAASLLFQRAERYFDALERSDADVDAQVQLWSWDDAAKELVKRSCSGAAASRLLAARLARDAYCVASENTQIRILYLATMLEQAVYENGLEKPLPMGAGTAAAKAAEFGAETVQDVLAYATRGGHVGAAAAAARILGLQPEAAKLLYQSPQPAPLVAAARHPDRRVRFAAVEAITALGPTMPFAGSSYVADALGHFAACGGSRRVLVAGPVTEESHRIGGYLAAMGYEVETAATGRELIRLAIASPDYELALVAASLQKPTVDLLLQQLRHDFRTAGLPVAVVARSGELGRAKHAARNDPLAEAFPRPHTQEAVAAMVQRLTARLGPELVPHAERRQQAAQSLRWLAELIGKDQKIYNFKAAEDAALAARYVPELGLDAVAVLGNLGTPTSQQALVDLASRRTQPLALRTAAAEAFWQNAEKHGVLLTPTQILLQYDRYNQSAGQDAATQQVLASILNCIEAPPRLATEGSQENRESGSEP